MLVTVVRRTDKGMDECGCRDAYVIKVDGDEVFRVQDGEPEDSNLARDFNDVVVIPSLMRMAYSAGYNDGSAKIINNDRFVVVNEESDEV